MLDLGRVPKQQCPGSLTSYTQVLPRLLFNDFSHDRTCPTLTPIPEWQAGMAPQRVIEGLRLRRAACWEQL